MTTISSISTQSFASRWRLELAWAALALLTLAGALLGEGATTGSWAAGVVACLLLVKGRILTDRYLELPAAHPLIRRFVLGFLYLMTTLTLVSALFGDTIAALTRLR